MRYTIPFSTSETPALSQVGGKGLSLILMTQQKFPVPPGFILTLDFFQSWLDAIYQSDEWEEVLSCNPEARAQAMIKLKRMAMQFSLDDARLGALNNAMDQLKKEEGELLWAVRSSSPEEDLDEASFAGGYETVLGVTDNTLEAAIQQAFISCLDERIFLYKQEHGFPVDELRIAVIVQTQIASETAGAAFTLNPLNNCYDEAVINANVGLGESVVSGLASPDLFVVDKVTGTILERKPGKKETAIWLRPGGGTYEDKFRESNELCLRDDQVMELVDILIQVENYYQKPLDIEWAFANGNLYLLQARPITAYFPLPDELLTQPGEPKKLYLDLTLTKWGMQLPLSVLGTDFLRMIKYTFLRHTLGQDNSLETLQALCQTLYGRTYAMVSNIIKVQGGKKRVAAEMRTMDTLTADILADINEDEYMPAKTPPALKGLIFKAIKVNLGTVFLVLKIARDPERYKRVHNEVILNFYKKLSKLSESSSGVRSLSRQVIEAFFQYVEIAMAILYFAEFNRVRIKGMFKKESAAVQEKVVYLERALPENPTTQMGLALFQLSSFKDIESCRTAAEFERRLQDRSFSEEFLQAWEHFMTKYGFRGPDEMDLGAKRFQEQPAYIFAQLRSLKDNTDATANPQVIFEQAQEQREKSYAQLHDIARLQGKRKARKFAKAYHNFVTFGGYRETPKYHLAMIIGILRERVLEIGDELVEAGRLDHAEQVFNLRMDELDRALVDPSLELRALIADNIWFYKKLHSLKNLPRVVDSRGKILQARKKEKADADFIGDPISPGTVTGSIKVLKSPDEKPILPGEILVARATDPGWTPLFVNAAGVILEVGGMLQHGALVAREYGKPCICGVETATSALQDGQIVEMNGTDGTIKLVPAEI